MPFRILTGRFFCVNYSPDGDTIRFSSDQISDLGLLDGVPPEINKRGHISLRLEGIDALETHFEGRHQPLNLANAARNALLDFVGIRNVQWDANAGSVIAADDGSPGYILARSTDKFGRVIAFAFADVAPVATGSEIFAKARDLDNSVNIHLLSRGFAYPTYYWTLFAELREYLTASVDAARAAGLGVHAVDATNTLSSIVNIGTLTDQLVLMPKLFRRASAYVAAAGTIIGFKAALEANQEPVFDLRDKNFTHFDTFVTEQGDQIALTRRPEELVFDPMPERPGGEFTAMMNDQG